MAKLLRMRLNCTAAGNYIYTFFALLLFSVPAKGQNICIDSSRINYFTSCPNNYEPVCGCNNQTYRNACKATNHFGIISYQNGICEPVALDFNPNPVDNYMDLTIIRKEEGAVQIVIYDVYGKVFYEQFYNRIQNHKEKLDTSRLPHGVYIIVAYTTRYGTWRKFVKNTLP